MTKGLAIFSWDQKIGSILEVKYPKTLELSSGLINKIYMTHAYSEQFENEEFIEINYNENLVFSYCDKSRVPEYGYEVLIYLIDLKDKVNLEKIKKHFIEFGKTLFQKPEEQREKYFLDYVPAIYKKSTAKKILLLGRAGTGKTSIKKIIFEGKDPKDLLFNPLDPTRGVSPSIYSWLNLKLGLFDTSGQELSYLLNEDNTHEKKIAFENADVILYLFDYSLWVNKRELIFDDLNNISSIIKKKLKYTQLVVFLHKIDLIEKNTREETYKKIKSRLKEDFEIPVYFTSIYPNLIYNLYNAFYEILSYFSEDTQHIKQILDDLISDLNNIMCYITNNNNAIIIQTMDQEFNTNFINHTHKMIAQLNQSIENMLEKNNIDHLILSSSKSINIIMNYLNLSKFNLNNLVIMSETLSANKLIFLAGKIRGKLNKFYLYRNKQIFKKDE
jgi:predicted AAA+ superfamily ATPase